MIILCLLNYLDLAHTVIVCAVCAKVNWSDHLKENLHLSLGS